MRLADITIGNTYVVGRRESVNTGLYGVPVIVLAKGKFTTVSQPCGQMIVPFEGEKRTEVLVAVRACDANQLRRRNSWSDRLPRYRAPNNPYTAAEVTEAGYDGGRRVPYSLARDGQHWIPMIVAPTKIMMSEEEFRVKEEPAREVFDALRASRERREKARTAYTQAIADLKGKANPTRRISMKGRPVTLHAREETIYLTLDEYIALLEKAQVRGVKTRIRNLKSLRADWVDAMKQEATARSCVQKAGLG